MNYWELNENLEFKKNVEKIAEIMQKGLYPPKGVKILAHYISTSTNWGVTVLEAESAEAAMKEINVWRIAIPGFFKFVKQTLAMTTADSIKIHLEQLKETG